MTDIFEESPGVKSSKRTFGAALVGSGGVLLLAVGIVAIFRKVVDPATALASDRVCRPAGVARRRLPRRVLLRAGRLHGAQGCRLRA